MQLRERIKDAEKEGRAYGERRVQVIRTPGSQPINLHAMSRVQEEETTIRGTMTFEVDKVTGNWARNSPEEEARFLSLGQDTVSAVIIHPHHELRPNLPQVGWLTSAYLLAFYTLGYRYILHESLDPVRQHILSSFSSATVRSLRFPTSDEIALWECVDCFHQDPEIGVSIPLDGESPVCLEISFLDCHLNLPFRFVPQVLEQLVFSVPEIQSQLPELVKSGGSLYSPVACTKSDIHDCKWDYVLGKPVPAEV